MTRRRAWLVALVSVAVLLMAAAGGTWYSVRHFGAIVAEMPHFDTADVSRENLASAREDFRAAADEYDRWCARPRLALSEAIAGDSAVATALADQVLAEAPSRRDDWNYGNAIHKAHLAKGHLALATGDRDEAKRHLLAAGETPGSPQLNSFGPSMNLARDLLRLGEREAVLAYIDRIEHFWKMDNGAIAKWREMIRDGREPNFAMNLR